MNPALANDSLTACPRCGGRRDAPDLTTCWLCHRRQILAATAAMIAAVYCPGCKAAPGQVCVSASYRPTRIHILRVNLAKREASPGPCPTGCGDDLRTVNTLVGHARTGRFECQLSSEPPTTVASELAPEWTQR